MGKYIYVAHPDLTNILTTMLETFSYVRAECLFQFWRAEEETSVNDFGERRFILTTHNQPFLFSGRKHSKDAPIREGISSYRIKMADIVAGDGGRGGVIGRVFLNKRMESTPDIRFYSVEENPHQDLALSCNIRPCLAIPLFDSSGCSVGVLEIVSEYTQYFSTKFHLALQNSSSLRYLRHCKDLCGQCDLEDESLFIAVSEIKGVMKMISRSHRLACAQTWMLCNNCSSLSTSKSLDFKLDASYWAHSVCSYGINLCLVAEYLLCTLKRGEGVVGKAAISPHNLVYCDDVSQFSITDYRLAHFARDNHLKSCFAICLKSDLTGSQSYVLEFSLYPIKDNIEAMRAILIPILKKMRQNFKTFKLASGEEIGDNLSVQVIYARSPDKIVTLRNRNRNRKREREKHSIGDSSTEETDDLTTGQETSSQDNFVKETPFSASTVQSELRVTVKANCGDDSFIFQLSSSSGIYELSQQVSQSLNLDFETYVVKYLDDDNDLVLIVCDEDLHQYLSSSISKKNYTLTIWIEPK